MDKRVWTNLQMAQSQGGQAVSHIVDAHVAYCTAISDLSRDKTELLERIKQLEDRIHRAASAFFRDGSDGQVASQMLQILEEERRQK